MPRKAIELPDQIAYLSVLDEHGRVDTKLIPDLDRDQLLHLHRIMLLSRRFDERLMSSNAKVASGHLRLSRVKKRPNWAQWPLGVRTIGSCRRFAKPPPPSIAARLFPAC